MFKIAGLGLLGVVIAGILTLAVWGGLIAGLFYFGLWALRQFGVL